MEYLKPIVTLKTTESPANTYKDIKESLYKKYNLELDVLRQTLDNERVGKMKEVFQKIGENGNMKIVESDTTGRDSTDVILRKEVNKTLSGKTGVRLSHDTDVQLVGKGMYQYGEGADGRKHIYVQVKTSNNQIGWVASEHLATIQENPLMGPPIEKPEYKDSTDIPPAAKTNTVKENTGMPPAAKTNTVKENTGMPKATETVTEFYTISSLAHGIKQTREFLKKFGDWEEFDLLTLNETYKDIQLKDFEGAYSDGGTDVVAAAKKILPFIQWYIRKYPQDRNNTLQQLSEHYFGDTQSAISIPISTPKTVTESVFTHDRVPNQGLNNVLTKLTNFANLIKTPF